MRFIGLKTFRCTHYLKNKDQSSIMVLYISSCCCCCCCEVAFSRVRLCATPQTAAHQAPQSLGFSRQEHWSGLPFPSPMQESEKRKWSRSVVSDSQRPYGLQPARLLRPWDFPGKSPGVGCHCLLRSWGVRAMLLFSEFSCVFKIFHKVKKEKNWDSHKYVYIHAHLFLKILYFKIYSILSTLGFLWKEWCSS